MPIDPSTAFVSYSREDLEFVRRLAQDLKTNGAMVWMDKADLHPGQDWIAEVEAAVAGCQRMIVILSPASSTASRQVTNEFMAALEDGKVVIPVLFRDCKLPLQLRRLQYADFRTDYAVGMEELLASLRGDRPPEANPNEDGTLQQDRVGLQRIAEQQAQLEQERQRIATEQAQLDQERKKAASEKARLKQLELKHKAAEETSKQAEVDRQTLADEKARLERQRKKLEKEQARLDEEQRMAVAEKGRLSLLEQDRQTTLEKSKQEEALRQAAQARRDQEERVRQTPPQVDSEKPYYFANESGTGFTGLGWAVAIIGGLILFIIMLKLGFVK